MAGLRILILSDGRAGHFNLSEGIAAALGRLRPTQVARIDAKRGRWPGAALAALVGLRLPPRTMLRAVYGIDAGALPAADLVVSAGAETLAANIWVARALGCSNVFYGSLRWFAPSDFSVVLTSYARNASRPRHALALKPSPLDPSEIRPASTGTGAARGRPRRIALLIGGNAGTVHFGEDDWARLLAIMPAMTAAHGTRWLVSNSRRTPDAIGDRLGALAKARPDVIERFVDVRSAGAGTLRSILGAADAAVCTEDSSSMISECIWCRLPVVGVAPADSRLPRDEAHYRAWLTGQGWCRSLPIAALEPPALVACFAEVTPLAADPRDALAALLAERLPGLLTARLAP